MPSLLGVDLGVNCGLALFGKEERLVWQRSQNFGSVSRLRRAVPSLLRTIPNLSAIVAEGGGEIAEIWQREAERRALPFLLIDASTWRRDLLYEREQRSGIEAKQNADSLAYKVIRWSNLSPPRELRHDAAEAILVGLWGIMQSDWISKTEINMYILRNS